jgi:hypothetical protein
MGDDVCEGGREAWGQDEIAEGRGGGEVQDETGGF